MRKPGARPARISAGRTPHFIKNKKDRDNLKKAAEITVNIFDKVKKEIAPGVAEKFIAARLEQEMKALGLSRSFKTIVGSGPNGALPHAELTDRVFSKNDMIVIDFGVNYKGIKSDMTRTVVLGKPDSLLLKIYDAVAKAQRAAIKNIRPGLKISDYVRSVHDNMRARGYGTYIRHTLGHGVGNRIHEAPKLSERNKRRLQENMVVTIEPGLYIPGKGGVRIEDMVLICKKGCKVLTV